VWLSGVRLPSLVLPSLLVLRAFDNNQTGALDVAVFAGAPRLILALQRNQLPGPPPCRPPSRSCERAAAAAAPF
jgi:hypothetical protein